MCRFTSAVEPSHGLKQISATASSFDGVNLQLAWNFMPWILNMNGNWSSDVFSGARIKLNWRWANFNSKFSLQVRNINARNHIQVQRELEGKFLQLEKLSFMHLQLCMENWFRKTSRWNCTRRIKTTSANIGTKNTKKSVELRCIPHCLLCNRVHCYWRKMLRQ